MSGPPQGLGHSWQALGPRFMVVKFQFLARGLWYLVLVPTSTFIAHINKLRQGTPIVLP